MGRRDARPHNADAGLPQADQKAGDAETMPEISIPTPTME
jgi:hypothetical protein